MAAAVVDDVAGSLCRALLVGVSAPVPLELAPALPLGAALAAPVTETVAQMEAVALAHDVSLGAALGELERSPEGDGVMTVEPEPAALSEPLGDSGALGEDDAAAEELTDGTALGDCDVDAEAVASVVALTAAVEAVEGEASTDALGASVAAVEAVALVDALAAAVAGALAEPVLVVEGVMLPVGDSVCVGVCVGDGELDSDDPVLVVLVGVGVGDGEAVDDSVPDGVPESEAVGVCELESEPVGDCEAVSEGVCDSELEAVVDGVSVGVGVKEPVAEFVAD